MAAPPAEPWQAQPWQGMAEPQLTPPMPWQGSGDAPAAPPGSTWQADGAHAAAEAPQVLALQGPGQWHGGQGGAAAAHSAQSGASAAGGAEPYGYTAWSSGPAAEAAAGAAPRTGLPWAAEKGAAAQVPDQWAAAASPTRQGFTAAAPSSAEEALRSPAGRPPCAAVAWGFGGRVVLLQPGTLLFGTLQPAVSLALLSGGHVVLLWLSAPLFHPCANPNNPYGGHKLETDGTEFQARLQLIQHR